MTTRLTAALLGVGQFVVGLLLVPGWLIVDIDDSWRLMPEQVPDALLLAIDRGVGAWELPGMGIVLVLVWLGAAVALGLAVRSQRPGWLLVSGLSSLAVGIFGLITIAVLIVASVAIGLLLPSDWDSFDPNLRIGWAAYAFSIGSIFIAGATLIVWFRRRGT